ncbi:Uncharacterized protein DAT39_014948 [Clarias magur]|uniref:Uncharacterized protein n=1 Tax=Clarias magur TaxID=1594786 RepID=A0A8J4UIM9_CLAMG|nr:Uncharacterized protein DAT39_014948 [Clarias magur]
MNQPASGFRREKWPCDHRRQHMGGHRTGNRKRDRIQCVHVGEREERPSSCLTTERLRGIQTPATHVRVL